MAEIVQLSEYRQRDRVRIGFKLWRRTFGQSFDHETRLNDLSPKILCRLADPSESSAVFFYSLILGSLGYEERMTFDALDNAAQVQVVDIHLFLADQVRFEMMRRMGWLARFSATQYRLFDMVVQFEHIRALCRQDPPRLAPSHPGHAEYIQLIPQDQQVFIRRLLPSCLDAFKRDYTI